MAGKKRTSDFLEEARNLARNGFYREALLLYQNIWSQNPSSEQALYGVAACFLRLRNLRQAEYHAKLLLQKSPRDPKAERLLQLIDEARAQQGDHRRRTLLEDAGETYADEDLRENSSGPRRRDLYP